MTLPIKPITLRLPQHDRQQFQRLVDEFPGLPIGTVLRMLIADLLDRPIAEQIAAVERRIRHPGASGARSPSSGRTRST